MSPTILALPEELLAQVCDHLIGDNAALNNWSQTCKKLCHIAEDALYHAVSVEANYPYQYDFPRLIRTLLDRPVLAAKVHDLSLQVSLYNDPVLYDELTYDAAGVFCNHEMVTTCIAGLGAKMPSYGQTVEWAVRLSGLEPCAYA
jgi:hypothetical protein